MNFAHNVLPRVDFDGEKDHGMAAVANAAVGDDVSVFEKLKNVSEQGATKYANSCLTSTSCCWRWLRV